MNGSIHLPLRKTALALLPAWKIYSDATVEINGDFFFFYITDVLSNTLC